MDQVESSSKSVTADGPGSNKAFGYTFAVVFLLLTAWQAWLAHWTAAVVLLVLATAFGLAAAFAPARLATLNLVWFRFGGVLHAIISPIVLGGIFFLAVTPTGLLMRAFRKDPLRLKFQPSSASYWIRREPPGPSADSFKNQF